MTFTQQDYSTERRLHILSIFYNGIIRSPGIIIPLYFVISQQDTEELIFILIMVFVGLIALPSLLLSYYYFTYYITENELVIKSGVLSRRQRNIPLERIQNIDITQNFLHRLLGIAKVQAETAGGAESEGVLEYVSKKDAETIRNVIKSYQKIINRESADILPQTVLNDEHYIKLELNKNNIIENQSAVSGLNEKIIFKMSLKDNFIHGMLRFRPVMIIVMAWIFSFVQQFHLAPSVEDFIPKQYFNSLMDMTTAEIVLYIVVVVFIIVFLSWILDILLTVNKFYGFTLSIEDNKLHTQYGLLNKRKGTIPLKKLQMMVIRTNPIRKKLGYATLALETAGLANKGKGPELAVPFAKIDRVIELTKGLRKFNFPENFIPVSKKTIKRAMIRYIILLSPFLITGIILLPELSWCLILTPLLYLAAYLRWKYRGYLIVDNTILIKQGFWFRRVSIIPVEKIQTLNIVETFFQRRLKLGSIYIDSAATGLAKDAGIEDVDTNEATNLMDLLIAAFKVVSIKSNE